MKIIKNIVEDIEEEIDASEHYAMLATQYKDTDKILADGYANMAAQELGHVDALHAQVVRIIKDYKAKGNEVPAAMQAVFDYTHQREVDRVAKIKVLLEIYKK